MFRLNENYEVDREILKCVYIRYSPAETSTINPPTSQTNIGIPREDSVIPLLNIYLELNFEVIKKLIIPDAKNTFNKMDHSLPKC